MNASPCPARSWTHRGMVPLQVEMTHAGLCAQDRAAARPSGPLSLSSSSGNTVPALCRAERPACAAPIHRGALAYHAMPLGAEGLGELGQVGAPPNGCRIAVEMLGIKKLAAFIVSDRDQIAMPEQGRVQAHCGGPGLRCASLLDF